MITAPLNHNRLNVRAPSSFLRQKYPWLTHSRTVANVNDVIYLSNLYQNLVDVEASITNDTIILPVEDLNTLSSIFKKHLISFSASIAGTSYSELIEKIIKIAPEVVGYKIMKRRAVISRTPVRGVTVNKTNPLARGLVGYWPTRFTNNNTLYDYSGYNNNLTPISTSSQPTITPHTRGLVGDYDGVDDDFSAPIVPEHDLTTQGAMIVECGVSDVAWWPGNDYAMGAAGRRYHGNIMVERAYAIGLYHGSGTSQVVKIIMRDSVGGIALTGTTQVTTNKMHTLGLTWSHGIVEVYLDGILETSGTFTAPLQSSSVYPFRLGYDVKLNWQSVAYWKGWIGDSMLFNRYVSPAEMLRLHQDHNALFSRSQVVSSSYSLSKNMPIDLSADLLSSLKTLLIDVTAGGVGGSVSTNNILLIDLINNVDLEYKPLVETVTKIADTKSLPAEILRGLILDDSIPIENLAALVSSNNLPVGTKLKIPTTNNLPIEGGVEVGKEESSPIEHLSSIDISPSVPISNGGAAGLSFLNNLPIEVLQGIEDANGLPVSSIAKLMLAHNNPISFLSSVINTYNKPIETLLGIEQQTGVTPIEALSGFLNTPDLPIEVQGMAVMSTLHNTPIESLIEIAVDNNLGTEALLSFPTLPNELSVEHLISLSESKSVDIDQSVIIILSAIKSIPIERLVYTNIDSSVLNIDCVRSISDVTLYNAAIEILAGLSEQEKALLDVDGVAVVIKVLQWILDQATHTWNLETCRATWNIN